MWNNILYTGYAKRNICYIELCVIISVVYLDVNSNYNSIKNVPFTSITNIKIIVTTITVTL